MLPTREGRIAIEESIRKPVMDTADERIARAVVPPVIRSQSRLERQQRRGARGVDLRFEDGAEVVR